MTRALLWWDRIRVIWDLRRKSPSRIWMNKAHYGGREPHGRNRNSESWLLILFSGRDELTLLLGLCSMLIPPHWSHCWSGSWSLWHNRKYPCWLMANKHIWLYLSSTKITNFILFCENNDNSEFTLTTWICWWCRLSFQLVGNCS